MDQKEKDNYIFKYSPPGMQEWVQDCRKELGRPPKREDVVESVLELELPSADAYADIGLYTQIQSAGVPGQEAAACYDLDKPVPLPSSVETETDFRRPPEPRTVARIGTDLEKVWEVHVARQDRNEVEFREQSRSATQLGKWKYESATEAVSGLLEARLPLSPEWQHFALLCRTDGLGAEGLHLAVFLSEGPWSFDVRLVAPTWIEPQMSWADQQGSDQEREENVQRSLLYIYSRILPDLDNFLGAVDEQVLQRRHH